MWGPRTDDPMPAASVPARPAPLIDPFQRAITYPARLGDRPVRPALRLLHVRGHGVLPKRDLLTLVEELDRVCSVFVERGVRKLRITGGEPLVRRDIMRLFRNLSRHLASARWRR